MADTDGMLFVQVCFALPNKQSIIDLRIAAGCTIKDAVRMSGILQENGNIDITVMRVGVFGKLKTLDTLLNAGDRVEIYRPLIADPMESRRRRAEKNTGPAKQ